MASFPGPTQLFSLHLEKSLQQASGIVLLVTPLASDMVEEGKDLGDLDKRLHACLERTDLVFHRWLSFSINNS